MQPNVGATYLNEGAALIYKKDFNSALNALNRAIELDTKELYAAHYNRAIARENTGDVQGAYADFKRAGELRPNWEQIDRQLSRFTVTDG
jgi:tetratricopeptide (TPR) repeat protein